MVAIINAVQPAQLLCGVLSMQAAADQLRAAGAGAAAALPVVADDVAREAGSIKDTLVPQV